MKTKSKAQAFETVARSLREFGYPDATAAMVKDTWDALKAGKTDEEMPHGIVGRFAFSQLDEVKDALETLPD